MAPPPSYMSAVPTTDFKADTKVLDESVLDPNSSHPSSSLSTDHSLLDFPGPPDLFTTPHHCSAATPDELYFTLPRELGRNRPNKRNQFRGHSSHSSPLFNLKPGRHFVSPLSSLPTVASEPTLISTSDNYSPTQGSHLPHFPHSPYKHLSVTEPVLTRCPAPSSAVLPAPPPPPPCPAGPPRDLATAAWGCCCSFGDAATPLSRYLEKMGHAALPLLKAGGLPKTKPSDVQT